jgi:hypothetical protein
MRSSRDRLVFRLLSAIALVSGCSRLTGVDWSLIPAAGTDTGGTSTSDGGAVGDEAGTAAGGARPSNEAGEAGALAAGEGGAGGTETIGGRAGSAGGGGVAGKGGSGGAAGGAMGGTDSGGVAGNAGTGNTLGGAPPCTGTVTPVQATDLVLFDGGSGVKNMAWGGRVGLDKACSDARTAHHIAQTETHAFIVVDTMDTPNVWSTTFPNMPQNSRVVGPTGIEVASSFGDLMDQTIEQSLVCAGVFPASLSRWLTGSISSNATTDIPPNWIMKDSGPINNCTHWTLGEYDTEILARAGSTKYTDKRWYWADYDTRPFTGVACGSDTANVLCLAFNPQ